MELMGDLAVDPAGGALVPATETLVEWVSRDVPPHRVSRTPAV